jgi:hypothetical protein
VKVRHDEGIANRIGPEPCAGAREGASEASVGNRGRATASGDSVGGAQSSSLPRSRFPRWREGLSRTAFDPNVWTGGALQEGSVRLESSGRRRLLPPRPQDAEASARRGCQGRSASGPLEGLGLESIEHDGTLAQLGSLRGLGGWFRHFLDLEVATVMQHAPGDARELVCERDRQHVVV